MDGQLKTNKLAKPELILHFEPLQTGGQLSVVLTNAISARNIQLQEIVTENSIAGPSQVIRKLTNQQSSARLQVTSSAKSDVAKSDAQDGSSRLSLEDFLMESCDEPMVFVLKYEDVKGNKFKSEFEIGYISYPTYNVHFRRSWEK